MRSPARHLIWLAPCLTGCATQPSRGVPPGFAMGLVHGFMAPFSLAASLFRDVRVYAYPNTGFGYESGFVLGAGLLGFLGLVVLVAAIPRIGGFLTRKE